METEEEGRDSPRVELGRDRPGGGVMDGTEDIEGTGVVRELVLLELGVSERDVDSPRVELGHIPGYSMDEGTPSISGSFVGAYRCTVSSMIWKYRKLLDKDKTGRYEENGTQREKIK